MKINIGKYILETREHHNGLLIVVHKQDYPYTAKFGLTKDGAWSLYDYHWLSIEDIITDDKGDMILRNPVRTFDNEIVKGATLLAENLHEGYLGDDNIILELNQDQLGFLTKLFQELFYDNDKSLNITLEEYGWKSNKDPILYNY